MLELRMPRYFMHLIDGTDEVLDPEGLEMAPDAVAEKALLAARDCMAGDVQAGRLKLGYRIEVRDEHGHLVHTQTFENALEFTS